MRTGRPHDDDKFQLQSEFQPTRMAPVSKLLRKITVLLLMCGLPVQSLHAVAMPLCNQDGQKTAALHEHAQQGDAAGQEHDNDVTDTDSACDGCDLCHTCSAPTIASIAIDVLLDTVETPPAAPLSHISLFVPEQPQRPPIA